jgi:sortase A
VALTIGAAAIFGWFATAQVGSATEQATLARELQEQAAKLPVRAVPIVPIHVSRSLRVAPAPGSFIGRVEITRIGVSAYAREGVDEWTLGRAVGHVPRTALPGERGNSAFAAHRDTFFRGLEDVRRGDTVVTTTPLGRHEYIVAETRVVDPGEAPISVRTHEPVLTLVTCYPFDYLGAAPKRFVVRAVLDR